LPPPTTDRAAAVDVAGLELGRGVGDAGALEMLQPVEGQAAVLHAGRDHDGAGADRHAVVEGELEAVRHGARPVTRRGTAKRVPNFSAWISPRAQRSAPEMPVGKPM
jgi:hypothetical protein